MVANSYSLLPKSLILYLKRGQKFGQVNKIRIWNSLSQTLGSGTHKHTHTYLYNIKVYLLCANFIVKCLLCCGIVVAWNIYTVRAYQNHFIGAVNGRISLLLRSVNVVFVPHHRFVSSKTPSFFVL